VTAWIDLGRARVALLLLGLMLLLPLGVYGLLEPTETRYAEIAREMRASGDWLRPRLDGISHFHKPPLAYWAAGAGMGVLGKNAAGARLFVVLASLITLAATALAVRRRFPSLGVSPAQAIWVLGTMLLFATLGRTLASDPFLAAAVATYWALAPSPWAIAALGVGFFAKGPVVFVHTALPVLLVALLGRDRRVLGSLGPARGWLLFAALGLPWFVIVGLRTPGLLTYLLENQIWGRFATTEHNRPGPPWYFVGVLLAGTLPWTAALLAGIARSWRERVNDEARLALAWVFAPLVLLSFSGSKLPAYLLPCFPPVALLAARGLEARWARLATAGLLALAIVAGVALGPAALGRLLGPEPRLPAVVMLPLVVAALASGWAALRIGRGRPVDGSLFLAVAYAALIVAASPFDAALGSPRRLAGVLAENRSPGEPVVEVARFNAGLPFYLGETVRLLEVEREPEFDPARRLDAVLVTRDSLAALATRHARVWTLGPAGRCAEIAEALDLRYTIVARWRKDALGFVSR